MANLRPIGFRLSATLLIATTLLGCIGLAAATADSSEYAAPLQKIFAHLDAHGVTMAFGGPIAAPLGLAQPGKLVEVKELPPVRINSDVVYVFDRLKDGSGCIILRFTPAGFVALRFDKNFEFVVGAVQPYGKPAAVLSGAAVEDILSQELHDCQTIASRLPAIRE